MSPTGIQAAMTLAGAMDTLAFRVFVRDILGPTLWAGQGVALDNLRVQHDPQIPTPIEERDCTLIHLPTSSPDRAPVEPAIAKIKAPLRKAAARTQDRSRSRHHRGERLGHRV